MPLFLGSQCGSPSVRFPSQGLNWYRQTVCVSSVVSGTFEDCLAPESSFPVVPICPLASEGSSRGRIISGEGNRMRRGPASPGPHRPHFQAPVLSVPLADLTPTPPASQPRTFLLGPLYQSLGDLPDLGIEPTTLTTSALRADSVLLSHCARVGSLV